MDIGDFRKFSEQNFSLSSSISQISELKEAIECIEGLDSERGVKYKVMAACCFEWDQMPYRFKVVRGNYAVSAHLSAAPHHFFILGESLLLAARP